MNLRVDEHDPTQPLLSNHVNDEGLEEQSTTRVRRKNSVASQFVRARSTTINSLRSTYETVKVHKTQFVLILLSGVLVYTGFLLAFMPSTSISRDFRRFHFSKLTKEEAYRIYVSSLLSSNNAKSHLRNYTAHRHWAGDMRALHYTVEQLQLLGFKPKLESYYPWLNTPINTSVSLWIDGELDYSASMIEDFLNDDPSSSREDSVMSFIGYSANGNVTKQYVFCNYGNLEDYEYLLASEIDLKDKIHIIRYSSVARGLKVKVAEEHGAAAVILYTDSFDDGPITEANGYKPYPHGPARHESSIQRGTVLYFSDQPGDPTTPGRAPKSPNTTRKSPKGKIPDIPSVAVSEREIAPILRQLNYKGVKIGRGGNVRGFEYFTGPSDPNTKVNVYNHQNYEIKEITNVVVEIPGLLYDNEVIIGNHRDSWTSGGAGDPNSGSAVLLEVARGLSAIIKKGWKPLRTIKLISWDAEEYGSIGSTSYGEDHAEDITAKAVAYLNLDVAVIGTEFGCAANPLLESLFVRASKYTPFKRQIDVTLYDYWKSSSNLSTKVLGAGSDFAVFQDHLGIPSGDVRFTTNITKDAVYQYHSNYDTYTWLEKYIDPGYQLHNTLAIFVGMSTLMISEDELLDFKTSNYMATIWHHYQDLYGLVNVTFPENTKIASLSAALSDQLQLVTFHSSYQFDENANDLRKDVICEYPWWKFYKKIAIYRRLINTNKKLKQLDRIFLTERGLKGRPWMKHSIFGPNKVLGYSGDVLPGLHEAILSKDSDGVIEWLKILSTQIDYVTSLLTVEI
ncbi:putative zinc metalloprotease Ecym_1131 [Eremothecium cymbalariae DBVPG|uniref:Peptide hydrolase n=1 Tax=Eremothecium cymbalariae (strain CBS 270.75 / DBVPG 7215 / KCTC 17166 / NRRL Y-17582) TaxID=931890 RepID=G8JMM8_ERECY|nr:hypothetical protein Ecym_1131 [Eremothecium cymbalariae DBVPG\